MKKLSLFLVVALTVAMVSCEKIECPTVVTKSATEITESTAKVVGQVAADGGAEVRERGVCWNTEGTPTLLDYCVKDVKFGLGTFTSNLSNLKPNTTYYVRAYATNAVGTSYGEERSFTTKDIVKPEDPEKPEGVISCAEALAICKATDTTSTKETYTIRGYVTEVEETFNPKRGYVTFWMADKQGSDKVLLSYRVKPVKSSDKAVKVNDYVEVVGTLVNYMGNTPEVNAGGTYTVITAGNDETPDTPDTPNTPVTPDTPDTPNTPDTPEDPEKPEGVISCAEALAICKATGTTTTKETYTIRGYVTEVEETFNPKRGYVTFWMADKQGSDKVLLSYRVKPVKSSDKAVKVNDYVEVVGTLVNYMGNTPEVNAGGTYTVITAGNDETPDTPDTPNTPDTPDIPDTPVTPDTPNTPDTPDTPDTPNTPDTPEDPEKPNHEWVDLGLSVKWATCNVGAGSPEEYGNYYAWGETEPKDYYSDETITFGLNISELESRGYIDNEGNLTSSYDAATANWGKEWRMPTEDEVKELIEKGIWTWQYLNGVKGYKVTGPSGNSIFLPPAGYLGWGWSEGVGRYGQYWSSTASEIKNVYGKISYDGSLLSFGDDYYHNGSDFRYYGMSVRPVLK